MLRTDEDAVLLIRDKSGVLFWGGVMDLSEHLNHLYKLWFAYTPIPYHVLNYPPSTYLSRIEVLSAFLSLRVS